MVALTFSQIVGLGLLVAWTVFAVIYANCIFPRQHAYLRLREVQENPRYPAFSRNDYPKWSFLQMTLGTVILVPFRFILVILIIFTGGVVGWVLSLLFCIRDYERPLNPCFRFIMNLTVGFFSRVIMWLMGFTCVSHHRIKYCGRNPHLVEVPMAQTSICVSNHVSFMDIFYFLAFYQYGFMAKSGVASTPFVGVLAKSIQCLFIERQSHDSRAAMFGKLETREHQIASGHRMNPLIIFPEGTTTNNKGLIDFKKGAFALLKPVRIFGLKYGSGFSAQLNMMNTLSSFLGLCMQLHNSLAVYEFQHPIGPSPSSSPEEFAENVKLLMCDEFGFDNFHDTFQDKVDFECKFLKADDAAYK